VVQLAVRAADIATTRSATFAGDMPNDLEFIVLSLVSPSVMQAADPRDDPGFEFARMTQVMPGRAPALPNGL
jgi:hypothetical protein